MRRRKVPWSIIGSVNPVNNDGLIAGDKAIVIGNVTADQIQETRASCCVSAWADRLFVNEHPATSGVAMT